MNFLKRAFFSIKVYWRKCLLTFAIFTCAFFLVLTAFLMLEGAGQSAKAMREQYHATITVVDYNVRSPDRYDSNLISPGTVEAFRAHPLAEHVTTFAYSAARSVPGLRPSQWKSSWKNTWPRPSRCRPQTMWRARRILP